MRKKAADIKQRQPWLGELIFVVGAIPLWFSGSVKAGAIYVDFKNHVDGVTRSAVTVLHTDRTGVSEGKDIFDARFLSTPAPALDMYALVPFDPPDLMRDARPKGSMNTINISISGRELNLPVNNELRFAIYNTNGQDGLPQNNFVNKNIFADLYTFDGSLIGTYNVKDYASNGTTIPLTINEGLSYTLNVRFEPNTFGFNELAAFADNWLQLCNTDNNKCDGLGEEGLYLTLIDFAYWADKWLLDGN